MEKMHITEKVYTLCNSHEELEALHLEIFKLTTSDEAPKLREEDRALLKELHQHILVSKHIMWKLQTSMVGQTFEGGTMTVEVG